MINGKRVLNIERIIAVIAILAMLSIVIFLAANSGITGFHILDSKEETAKQDAITVDLSDKREFNVGNFNIEVKAFENYIRVNLVDKEERNYMVYHFSNPPPSKNMAFTDSEGNSKTVSLENIPQQSKAEQPVSQRYGQYRDKIEEVLYDSAFLEDEGYKEGEKVPVIISLDVYKPKGLGIQSERDYFADAKNELLAGLEEKKGILEISSIEQTKDLRIINAVAIGITTNDLQALQKMNVVKKVSVDKKVYASLYDSVGLINASDLWKVQDSLGRNITGKNVTIAVIDTGIDYTHPDLGGCLGEGCKVIGGYDFVNKDSDPMDDQGHGTHVSATAAGNGILNGVAPDAKLYGYKVLGSDGSGSFSDVILGIQRAVDPNEDGSASDHLDIISMSLGGGGNPDDEVAQAVDTAFDSGVVVVVAAGNSGPSPGSIGSPGCARKALT